MIEKLLYKQKFCRKITDKTTYLYICSKKNTNDFEDRALFILWVRVTLRVEDEGYVIADIADIGGCNYNSLWKLLGK